MFGYLQQPAYHYRILFTGLVVAFLISCGGGGSGGGETNKAPVFTSDSMVLVEQGQTDTGYTANAVDPDSDSLSYSISGGADQGMFLIGDQSGVLSFKTAPVFSKPGDADLNNNYSIEIAVSDATNVVKQSVTVIVIAYFDISIEVFNLKGQGLVLQKAYFDDYPSYNVSLHNTSLFESDADEFTIDKNGLSTIELAMSNDSIYHVRVANHPEGQLCAVQKNQHLVSKDKTSVYIHCRNITTAGIFHNPYLSFGHVLSQAENGIIITSSAVGDIDADGDLDVVVGIRNGPLPNAVLFNDGNGSFTDSGQLLGNAQTMAVALVDVDGDTDLDLITANVDFFNGAPNKVWINDGKGIFTDSGQALGNDDTIMLAVGDVDGDKDMDFVTANSHTSNAIWLNNGSGKFTRSEQVLDGNGTVSVALGDVDGDKDLDLLVGNGSIGSGNYAKNSLWLNDGNGGFTLSDQVIGGILHSEVLTLGDVDSDKDLDIIIGSASSRAQSTNAIWLNDGTGVFTDSGQPLVINPQSIQMGDMDGDNDLDLVAGVGNVYTSWFNDGSGQFAMGDELFPFVSGMGAVISSLGDMDGDGDLDLISALPLSEHGWLQLNDGDGNFTLAGQKIGEAGDATFVHNFEDVDQDGDLDALATDTSGTVNTIWLNDGLGNFTDSVQDLGIFNVSAFADVDGDGDPDLITAFSGFEQLPGKLWLNDGQGRFTDIGQSFPHSGTAAIAIGDVDGDKDLDFVAGNSNARQDRLWLNDGKGNFTLSEQDLGTGNTLWVGLHDLDGDGDLDFIGSNKGFQGDSEIYFNDGMGHFSSSGQDISNDYGIGTPWARFAMGDIDGDGDIDIVVGNDSLEDSVWLNDGKGGFIESEQSLSNIRTICVNLADVDGDQDLDLITCNFDGVNIVWLNNGKGIFSDSGQTLAESASGIHFADIDNDADPDLIINRNRIHTNSIYLNKTVQP